jgi:hypothetical protein
MLGTKNQEQANPCGNLRNQKAPSRRLAPARCDGGRAHWDIQQELRPTKLKSAPPIEYGGDLRHVRSDEVIE